MLFHFVFHKHWVLSSRDSQSASVWGIHSRLIHSCVPVCVSMTLQLCLWYFQFYDYLRIFPVLFYSQRCFQCDGRQGTAAGLHRLQVAADTRQWTLYSTVYTVQYSVNCTLQCTLYSTVYSVHYSVHCTLECTLYWIQCTLCTVHCIYWAVKTQCAVY